MLINAGADVNAVDEEGDTPLDAAILEGCEEVEAILRKVGGKKGSELN